MEYDEEAWLTSQEPGHLLNIAGGYITPRMCRCVIAAATRPLLAEVSPAYRDFANAVNEALTEGRDAELQRDGTRRRDLAARSGLNRKDARSAAVAAVLTFVPGQFPFLSAHDQIGNVRQLRTTKSKKAIDTPDQVLSTLIRCVVGNPFHPVTFETSWQTSTVVGLAEGIYAERAFDRLPILADALEEAGCDNTAVLGHCRGPGPHARGCWVVDRLLGNG